MKAINIRINGRPVAQTVDDRLSLADFVRDHCLLTGTHVGCEHGVCGACPLMMDGKPVRSCITLAAAADGRDIRTVEGYEGDALMQAIRKAFNLRHALQCGFCTPGMLITLTEFLRDNPNPTEQEVRIAISGNLCRCTGYQGIVLAALDAAKRLQGAAPA